MMNKLNKNLIKQSGGEGPFYYLKPLNDSDGL